MCKIYERMSGVMLDKASLMLKKFIFWLKTNSSNSEFKYNFRNSFCKVILLLMRSTLGELREVTS